MFDSTDLITKGDVIRAVMALKAAESKDELRVGDEIFYRKNDTEEGRGIICSLEPNLVGKTVYILTDNYSYYWIRSDAITSKGRHFEGFAVALSAIRGD